MQRRTFLHTSLPTLATGFGLAHASRTGGQVDPDARAREGRKLRGEPFTMKFAPHFGMFRQHGGEDRVDQLKFMHEEGFRALEDNGMPRREPAEQERIGDALEELGMEMGVFVAHANFDSPTFVTDDANDVAALQEDMRRAVEVAKRCRAKWCTVVPGAYRNDMEWDYQTALVVDNLKRCAEILEPAGLTMVLEPLNHWTNHAGVFLTKMPQAFLLCRAVNSPACKILDDLYHQQITEGNLIPNIDKSWDEIAYYQVGDNPGRKEPTTGEIHYGNVFRHVHAKGYRGIVGMEHGNSKPGKEGERAVIDAYRACDPEG